MTWTNDDAAVLRRIANALELPLGSADNSRDLRWSEFFIAALPAMLRNRPKALPGEVAIECAKIADAMVVFEEGEPLDSVPGRPPAERP